MKTKNTYNTMKGLARKYAVPAMIGLGVLGTGCGQKTSYDAELPITQETAQSIQDSYNTERERVFDGHKTNLDGLVEKYENMRTELERDFNNSIADRVYDATEQKSIYDKGFEMNKVFGEFEALKDKANDGGFEYNSKIGNSSATNFYELSGTELEKVMKNKGLEVEVQGN